MAAGKKEDSDGLKPICGNRRAYHEYEVFETLECGLVLTGTEVKSLRDGAGSLEEAYAIARYVRTFVPGSEISRPDFNAPEKPAAPQATPPKLPAGS